MQGGGKKGPHWPPSLSLARRLCLGLGLWGWKGREALLCLTHPTVLKLDRKPLAYGAGLRAFGKRGRPCLVSRCGGCSGCFPTGVLGAFLWLPGEWPSALSWLRLDWLPQPCMVGCEVGVGGSEEAGGIPGMWWAGFRGKTLVDTAPEGRGLSWKLTGGRGHSRAPGGPSLTLFSLSPVAGLSVGASWGNAFPLPPHTAPHRSTLATPGGPFHRHSSPSSFSFTTWAACCQELGPQATCPHLTSGPVGGWAGRGRPLVFGASPLPAGGWEPGPGAQGARWLGAV